MDDEIAKLKALKAELGSSGQNWAVDKKLSGSKEGPKPPPAASQAGAPAQDPRVKEQGDLVRRLKSAKVTSIQTLPFPPSATASFELGVGQDSYYPSQAPKEEIAEAVTKLKELKAQFGEGPPAANGPTPAKGGGGGTGGGGGGKLILKTAKGTRDYQPAQMAVREKVTFKFAIFCLRHIINS